MQTHGESNSPGERQAENAPHFDVKSPFPDPAGARASNLYQGDKGRGFKPKALRDHARGLNRHHLASFQSTHAHVERSLSPETIGSHRHGWGSHPIYSSKTFQTLDTQLPSIGLGGLPGPLKFGTMERETPVAEAKAGITSNPSLFNEMDNFHLLEPFIALSKNPSVTARQDPLDNYSLEEDMDPKFATPDDVELDEEALHRDCSLDSDEHIVAKEEVLEHIKDHLGEHGVKMALRNLGYAPPRQSDPTPCLLPKDLISKRLESTDTGMEIETPTDQECYSETPESGQRVAAPQTGATCCTCKRSKCLKLYCECFRSNGYCGPGCNCTECYNRPEFADVRNQFFAEQLQRNPSSFSSKIVSVPGASVYARGCNCRKTGCSKNYCECFAAKVKCTQLCRCNPCQNLDESVSKCHLESLQDRQVKKRRKSEKNFQQSLKERLESRQLGA